MKNDAFLTLEKCDLDICDELEFSLDFKKMEAVIETYFDTDKKFGLNIADKDGAWIYMFAKYNPFENMLAIENIIVTDDINVKRIYEPTDIESKTIKLLIEEKCIKQMGLTCKDALIREYVDNVEKISLVCKKNIRKQISNPKCLG